MPKGFNNWRYQEVVKFLQKRDFCLLDRGRGSHQRWISPDKKHLVSLYSLTGNKSYPIKTMESIVRQSGLPKEEWLDQDKTGSKV